MGYAEGTALVSGNLRQITDACLGFDWNVLVHRIMILHRAFNSLANYNTWNHTDSIYLPMFPDFMVTL